MPTKEQERIQGNTRLKEILRKIGKLQEIGSSSNYTLITKDGKRIVLERFLSTERMNTLLQLLQKLPEHLVSVGFFIEFTNRAGELPIFKSSDIVGHPIEPEIIDFFDSLGSDAEKKQFAIDSRKAEKLFSESTAVLDAIRVRQILKDIVLNSRCDDLKRIESQIQTLQDQKIECSNELKTLADFMLAISKLQRIFVGDGVMRTIVPSSIPRFTYLENQISQLEMRLEGLQQERAHAEHLVSDAVFEKKMVDSAFSFASKKVQKAENHVREILLGFNRRRLGII
jgi:hypothetical protein